MQLDQRTIIVTGAGSGIGRELTLQLLQKGANVAAIDVNVRSLQETRQRTGVDETRLKTVVLDITDQEKVSSLPQLLIDHFGAVDGLINNAGIIQPFVPINDLSMADIQRVMTVNFFGTLYLTKAFLPHFLKRPEAHIMNVSSMGGFLAVPGQTLYGAAKAAVKLLTEGLYAELVDTNVRVTVVFPGAIATNITENSGLGKPKAGGNSKLKPLPAEKAAEIILKGMERNKFRVLVGNDARLLDWLYRLHPRKAIELIQRQLKSLRST